MSARPTGDCGRADPPPAAVKNDTVDSSVAFMSDAARAGRGPGAFGGGGGGEVALGAPEDGAGEQPAGYSSVRCASAQSAHSVS